MERLPIAIPNEDGSSITGILDHLDRAGIKSETKGKMLAHAQAIVERIHAVVGESSEVNALQQMSVLAFTLQGLVAIGDYAFPGTDAIKTIEQVIMRDDVALYHFFCIQSLIGYGDDGFTYRELRPRADEDYHTFMTRMEEN